MLFPAGMAQQRREERFREGACRADLFVLAAVLATGFPWHVEGGQCRASLDLAVGMDDVHHARLLVLAAEPPFLLSQVVKPGAYLAIRSRTDSNHDASLGP